VPARLVGARHCCFHTLLIHERHLGGH
jgi:hypothetical protein